MPTVLIIDDDRDVRETLSLVLEEAGYRVFTAMRGVAGAQVFRDEHPDLVITDMIMPDSDGIEAIRAIKALDPAARVIATSGSSFAGASYYLNLARQFGAMAVLPKPFEADELLSIVASCLAANPQPATEEPDPTK